ncbi:hypothetical protein OH76DRAFT_1480632 [Lentinus brumalis]|uniref:Asl1-like glycosyl hydrolase catalytic domain-containing protein n=1 Tax=Lentinus brumalis TaxID=2498619 RepID=A0A371DJ08_9APHY|nr:hypothetical protein OH76DRAFT_1480632 [Polyporus brumalis]
MFSAAALAAFLAIVPCIVAAQKAGLPWTTPALNIGQFLTTGKVKWYYTYGISTVSTSAEFVPLLFGPSQAAQWDSNIKSVIKNHGVKHVLGFNEPNEEGQANLSPQAAAALWKQHIQPLKAQGVLLGSPAPGPSGNGVQWLQQFIQACSGCNVDFIAVHQYDTSTSSFKAAIQQYHNAFPGKPIWVTEWACEDFNSGGKGPCSASAASSFMKTIQAFFDSQSYIERYAWFGVFPNTSPIDLVDSSGRINALGKQYIGA